jgi:hypothetical protein
VETSGKASSDMKREIPAELIGARMSRVHGEKTRRDDGSQEIEA